MEKKSSSKNNNESSFVNKLFGPESSNPAQGSSSNVFGSIFGPTPTGGPKDGQSGNMKHGAPGNGSKNKSNYQQETNDLCFYSNSIYYGGQDDVSPTTRNAETQRNVKKDNPPGVDTRGNWWQGSYYY